MKVAILAGGLGKRLRPLTADRPKALVEVCGRPIVEWQIELMKRRGFTDFVILAGYRWEKLVQHLGSGKRLGVRISYVVEDEPLGTGGAIKNAEHVLKDSPFIVMNGDVITDLDPRKLIDLVMGDPTAVAGIALVPMRSPYGVVKVSNGYVEEFVEKPRLGYWINAGVYVMKPEVFQYLPEKGDIEKTAFPELARSKRLRAYSYDKVFWRAIDTVKDVDEASTELRKLYPDICLAE
ncbi:MAG: nucleotidyltransferase [Thermoprotei archaeon]|nr:MAG: nucleotidyltransferase [Thermoprotei archaeon]